MRIGYVIAAAAFLAASPAMADVVISSGPGDAGAAHQYQANQDRAAGHANMEAAHEQAAEGNYGNAARDRAAAHEDWHAARHQQFQANRDNDSGTTVQIR